MYICSQCQSSSPKWVGKCPSCGAWNTLEESISVVSKGKGKGGSTGKVLLSEKIGENISQYTPLQKIQSLSTELDAVLGGGMTPGSLILLSGEPGIGKSTLALQMCQWYATQIGKENTVLYVSGEEHIGQIFARAKRLSVESDAITFIADNSFDDIVTTIEHQSAEVIIIDSLSVLSSDRIDGAPGSISQIRVMTEVFMQLAKRTQKSILLIGHVTKDGSISGPKSLEHLVDVVLFLEGVRTENYRILRALKNRFGSTDAVGLFRMDEDGLHDLPNPGLEFVDTENLGLPGSALTFTIEGNRPLLIEVEALSTYTKFGYPKRSTRGIAQGKIDLLIAVMSKFTQTKLENSDVYMNIGRGLTISEPGIDLACVAALISSKKNIPLGKRVFLGEVSLTGVVKNVYLLDKRIHEAIKLGFTDIVIPEQYSGNIPDDSHISITRVAKISEIEKILN